MSQDDFVLEDQSKACGFCNKELGAKYNKLTLQSRAWKFEIVIHVCDDCFKTKTEQLKIDINFSI